MVTPLTASNFYVTSNTREISLGSPIKSFSIYNDGPNTVRFWTQDSGIHTIKINENLDMDSEYPIKKFFAACNSGETATIRFVGARKFVGNQEQPTNITRVFNQPAYIPYQTNSTSPQIDYTVLCLGILGTLAIIGIVLGILVIAKK